MNTYQRQKNEIERLRAALAEANRAAYNYLRIARIRRDKVMSALLGARTVCRIATAVCIVCGIISIACVVFAYAVAGAAK